LICEVESPVATGSSEGEEGLELEAESIFWSLFCLFFGVWLGFMWLTDLVKDYKIRFDFGF
jgi:hypothetical protein